MSRRSAAVVARSKCHPWPCPTPKPVRAVASAGVSMPSATTWALRASASSTSACTTTGRTVSAATPVTMLRSILMTSGVVATMCWPSVLTFGIVPLSVILAVNPAPVIGNSDLPARGTRCWTLGRQPATMGMMGEVPPRWAKPPAERDRRPGAECGGSCSRPWPGRTSAPTSRGRTASPAIAERRPLPGRAMGRPSGGRTAPQAVTERRRPGGSCHEARCPRTNDAGGRRSATLTGAEARRVQRPVKDSAAKVRRQPTPKSDYGPGTCYAEPVVLFACWSCGCVVGSVVTGAVTARIRAMSSSRVRVSACATSRSARVSGSAPGWLVRIWCR